MSETVETSLMQGMAIRLETDALRSKIRVHLYSADFRRTVSVVQFEERKEGVATNPDMLPTLSETDAQRLLEDLWRMGIRPKGYDQQAKAIDTSGVVEAMKAHMADLRTFAFGDRQKKEIP